MACERSTPAQSEQKIIGHSAYNMDWSITQLLLLTIQVRQAGLKTIHFILSFRFQDFPGNLQNVIGFIDIISQAMRCIKSA